LTKDFFRHLVDIVNKLTYSLGVGAGRRPRKQNEGRTAGTARPSEASGKDTRHDDSLRDPDRPQHQHVRREPPPTDCFGNELAQADYTPQDAAWKAEQDLSHNPDARYIVEFLPSANSYHADAPWIVTDRADDTVISSHKTRHEAQAAAEKAEREYQLREMCSAPEFARWARSLAEYEEQEIAEARISA
jgi:hypothetical protein